MSIQVALNKINEAIAQLEDAAKLLRSEARQYKANHYLLYGHILMCANDCDAAIKRLTDIRGIEEYIEEYLEENE